VRRIIIVFAGPSGRASHISGNASARLRGSRCATAIEGTRCCCGMKVGA
jgi:hypothetical protein